ncbi:hypothetical protein COT60_01105 [Candidatus Pacearchaeota archaeon CG09_land_8_20_14_0_10_30_9]|nr:hypothetical protein [Candidatus Pacearchaeota archaeon]OIO40793.1 MAG: hypothetical protein AUJ61_01090 [Candidatus Pacearchaeota archaeon CG1_02_30_18]PIN71673.1 MAG: hypothetical protein COV77_00825 [Candidatus Pacearchaeota archaeon CG11_big_fil_rev_8_21_14_0_20_30_13]PIO01311.1 MAG: hypothetical protein COT60_01105 [Candidatus Pacearchaeota archaeon CG09_land_8_20_14_0_10_30_9]PIZ82198.1 MAG: hypothetical protein COX98_00765 [Candidatus Pacearchaeota archaeon CG_4_10_14_0_2_um_filter_30
MNFIKKIVDKKIDELVHAQFQKFSRGIFKDRAVLKVKKSKGKYTINSSSEFANELIFIMAQKLGNKKTLVSGAVVSTSNLKEKIDFKEIKQFQGVKRYLIEKEMSGDELVKLILEFPKTFFGLSFQIDEENSLKVKPKAPKSGKPGKGDEEPKADFCKLITNDSELGKSFVFEKNDFKTAEIKHEFVIEEIILPQTEEKDFAKIREMAKRKGKIIRYANIDGLKSIKEYEFTA